MRKHLDSNVVYFMLLIFLVGFVISGFRYYQHLPCEGFGIAFKNKPYYVGEFISFKDATQGAEEWQWHFGDTSEVKSGQEVLHKFKTAGIHTISLRINGVCEAERSITIRDQKIISPKDVFFIAPDKVAVGETFEVKDTTSTSSSWEWRFGDGLAAVGTRQKETHSYEEPGTKTIRLLVNGNDHVSYQTIEVYEEEVIVSDPNEKIILEKKRKMNAWDTIPIPPSDIKELPKQNEVALAPSISPQEFKAKLKQLAAGKISTQNFGKYFCGGLNGPITTERRGIKTFLDVCQDIKGREIVVEELELIKNPDTKCIENLIINYKKKSKIKKQLSKIPLKPKS